MRQSLHIFCKDARFLRIEICLFLIVTALLGWTGGHPAPEILLEFAAVYLIARAVHAEPLPGDRQFWLTRPYERRSLVGAKLLFIAVFVCAPICAAQIAMLIAGGFPLLPAIPGLLWSQVLIFFVGSLLVMALAAMTPGVLVFMLSALGLAAIVLIIESSFPFIAVRYQTLFPPALEWIREYSVLAVLVLMAGFVLFWQYKHRATNFSWFAVAGGIALALTLFLWMPASLALSVQSWFSDNSIDESRIQVVIDPKTMGTGSRIYSLVRVVVPIAVRGQSPGIEAKLDTLSISLEWEKDRSWRPNRPPGVNPRAEAPGVSVSDVTLLMDPALYSVHRMEPVTITGAVYVTLFGDTRTRTMSVRARPVNFQDGLQCFEGAFHSLYCRSFFRWPARLVYAASGGMESALRNSMVSYSPFPADAGLTTMDTRSAEVLLRTSEVTIVTKRPLAHFWRKFQVRGLRLSDFERR